MRISRKAAQLLAKVHYGIDPLAGLHYTVKRAVRTHIKHLANLGLIRDGALSDVGYELLRQFPRDGAALS